MRLALAVGLALALGARAARAEAPPDPAAELERAYTGGEYSAALRLGAKLTAEAPGDVNAHYYYGLTLADVGDLDAAVAELERARALMPTSPEVLFALAGTVGDERVAREHFEAARRLAPDHPQVAALEEQFEILLHAGAGVRGHFTAGSAEAYVEDVMEQLERGNPEQVILEHVARPTIVGLMAEMGGREPTAAEMREFVQGAVAAWRAGAADQVQRYHGFKVMRAEPPIAPGASAAEVTVEIVLERRVTGRQTQAMRAMYADPGTREMLDPQLVRLLDGLDPADEDKMFRRMIAGRQAPVMIPLALALVRDGGRWRIADFTMEGQRLRDLLRRVDDLIDKGVVERPARKRDWFRIGQGVGRMLGIAIGLALVSWLIVRGRRRRNAALK